jgi:hypothetical protein
MLGGYPTGILTRGPILVAKYVQLRAEPARHGDMVGSPLYLHDGRIRVEILLLDTRSTVWNRIRLATMSLAEAWKRSKSRCIAAPSRW